MPSKLSLLEENLNKARKNMKEVMTEQQEK